MGKNSGSDSFRGDVMIQWIGDISLNGLFCDPQCHSRLTANLEEVSGILGKSDLRIANWESPLWGDGGVNVLKFPRTCTTEAAALAAMPLGLDVALLANNHAYDCLEVGFDNTTRFFDERNIGWLGAGRTKEEAARSLVREVNDRRIGILNYVGMETNPKLPQEAGVFLNVLEEDRVVDDVKSLASEVDTVVVCLHWGAIELIWIPTVEQRRMARRFIEAGASVVAGHHAHCLHGMERWQDGCIIYGLGNFLFDGCHSGQLGRFWPKLSRRVGVFSTEITSQGVGEIRPHFLFQNELWLSDDNTPSRNRRQERLNRMLLLSDQRLARLMKRTLFVQWALVAPFRFLWESGGPIRAVRRLTWGHVRGFFKAVLGRWGK